MIIGRLSLAAVAGIVTIVGVVALPSETSSKAVGLESLRDASDALESGCNSCSADHVLAVVQPPSPNHMQQNQIPKPTNFFTGAPPYPWHQWVSMMNPSNKKPHDLLRVVETQFAPMPQIIDVTPSSPSFSLVSGTGGLDPAMLPDPPGLRMDSKSFDRLIFPGAMLTAKDAGNPLRMDFYAKAGASPGTLLTSGKMTIHPAVIVGGIPYWAPSKPLKHIPSGSAQDNFVSENVTPADFIAVVPTPSGSQKPDLGCQAKDFKLGIRVTVQTNYSTLFLDNIDIRAVLGCCPTPSLGWKDELRALMAKSGSRFGSFNQGSSRGSATGPQAGRRENSPSKQGPAPCCGDDVFDLTTPPQFDPELGANAQYFEYEEPVKNLFPDFEPTEEWYAQKQPCEPAIGGIDPSGLLDDESKKFLGKGENDGSDGWELDLRTIKKFIDEVKKHTEEKWPTTTIVDPWKPSMGHTWVPPLNPEYKYAFEGADIVYVPGWDMVALAERLGQITWKKQYSWVNAPLGAPANSVNPDYYNPSGYFMKVALGKWHGKISDLNDGHTDVFLRQGWNSSVVNTSIGNQGIPKGYANRCLVVSYNIAGAAEDNAVAILRQVADAMIYGTNVLDPLANPVVVNSGGVKRSTFGSRGLVFISQSTGALLTNIALCKAQEDPNLGASYIPQMTKLHIANQGAFRGSKIAEKVISGTFALEQLAASQVSAQISAWFAGAPILQNFGPKVLQAIASKTSSFLPSNVMMESTLFDLMPAIAVGRWKPLLKKADFPTYCVVGSHPSMFATMKWTWLPGFDDGVLTADSQSAREFDLDAGTVLGTISSMFLSSMPEPSGINLGMPGLQLLAFDLGIAWPSNGSVTIGGIPLQVALGSNGNSVPNPKFSVNVSGGRGQMLRALGYMVDHADGVLQPNPITYFLAQQKLSTGMTRAFTHTGMLLKHLDWIPLPASGRRQFSDRYFLGIGSASDHFRGTNGEFPLSGFQLKYPQYKETLGKKTQQNDEETFIMSDKAKIEEQYRPELLKNVTLPGEHNWPVDAPIALAKHFPVVEVKRELKAGIKVLGKVKQKTIFKRRYHLLAGWQQRMGFDYVYGGLLRRP